MKHLEICEAPICYDDPEKHERVWYPGEPLCLKSPYHQFQKIQKRINKLVKKGEFKNMDRYFTIGVMNKMRKVYKTTKGLSNN